MKTLGELKVGDEFWLVHYDGGYITNGSINPKEFDRIVETIRCFETRRNLNMMAKHEEGYDTMEFGHIYNTDSFDITTSNRMTAFYNIEAKNVMKSIKLIKSFGKKCCIVVNPKTDAKKVKKFLDSVDAVMVMTVEPGFGGQKFMENQLVKISKISNLIKKSGRKISLEVDGGINLVTAEIIKKAGADILVSGTAILMAKDYKDIIDELKK